MILRLVLFALILTGLAGFGTIAWIMLPDHATAAAATRKVTVVTITQPLRAGTLLKPEDLASKDIDEDKLPIGFVADEGDTRRSLIGGLVRHPLSPGDVLRLPGDALRVTDHGFLAAVLAPGTRAVTVGVDVVSGAAGLIWPGDRVDLILTQSIDSQTEAPGRRVAAETVLRDVRVIAIDQQIAQGGNETATVAKTVTLEVTPTKAEYVQVATKLGRLSLALRSAEAGPADLAPAPATTWAGDVSAALPKQQTVQTAPSNLRVFQGSADEKEYRF
jgi:pilus assembly protein CpaB